MIEESPFFCDFEFKPLHQEIPSQDQSYSNQKWLVSTIQSLCEDSNQLWKFESIYEQLKERGFITDECEVQRARSPFSQVYSSLGEIGEGGYGKVYKIQNLIDKQQYALKVIPITMDEMSQAMKEVQCLAAINSPRILRYYSSWLDKDEVNGDFSLYIQTELVSGKTLANLLKERKSVNVQNALYILKELTKALEEIHSVGVVHRDINPSNIIINENGNLKVIDFGISTFKVSKVNLVTEEESFGEPKYGSYHFHPIDQLCIEAADDNAKTVREVGTPLYSSPKQLLGKRSSEKDDIYSLGIITFEILSLFKTRMQKAKEITALRTDGRLPKEFQESFPLIAEWIRKMVGKSNRPTAKEILQSGIFNV
ncbi:AGC family protein kinase [Histomonas meleagridis]|uniref:AGC family protein kinase n=1 Tax=Histomonas meleagridis TaxID=135588 RepID=UPI00355A7CB9|nr:AGC family protein kinase [Histomonas meleagridis]KAH0804370.1 AGC family protein kinase [Histomonas meleagridis]